MKTIQPILIILILFTGLSSCGIYSFTGASIPAEAKTISIQYFPNNSPTVLPSLSQNFTDMLKDKFSTQTSLALITRGGDLQIEGEITGYAVSPVAIQGNDQAALNRLTITVNVRYTNKFNEKQNFESSFSRFADYPSNRSLAAEQAELIDEINKALVDDIFNRSVANW